MYNDIFLGSGQDLTENVKLTLIKRCPKVSIPRLRDAECIKRMTHLMISIYFTMIKKDHIKLDTKRKREINLYIKKNFALYGTPVILNLRKIKKIPEFLTGLQGGYYDSIVQGVLANNILESIVT